MPDETERRRSYDDDSIVRALPELVAFMRRDGMIIKELGGRQLSLPGCGQLAGKNFTHIWPDDVAALLSRMISRALRTRSSSDEQFALGARRYDVRIMPHGPDRVLCVVRDAAAISAPVDRESAPGGTGNRFSPRAMLGRLEESIVAARLKEQSLATCMFHLQGLKELGRVLDYGIVDQVSESHLQNLSQAFREGISGYACRLTENLFVAVIERFGDRDTLRATAMRLQHVLAQPVSVGDAAFTATPSAGLALLGDDASDARQLLEFSRSAMLEARRSGAAVHFYSDTLRLRSLARLDLVQELKSALVEDRLALRYAARHSLVTGKLVAVHAYLRWPHPVRGEVAAADLLPIAESCGFSTPLSRWAFSRLQRDLPAFRAAGALQMRFSFGALRSHLLSDSFAAEVREFLDRRIVAPEDFELRISERTLASLANPLGAIRPLADLGVAIVIDEFGKGFTSLTQLAQLPVRALLLDRRLTLAAATDQAALKAARAAIAIAGMLDLVPMASGIDSEAEWRLFESLGCAEGLGDVFGPISLATGEPADRLRSGPRRPDNGKSAI
jgi:diguanylate cyclase